MAIKITFARNNEYSSLYQIIQSKIDLGLEIFQGYLEGYFEPTKLEIWLYSPMIELGGKQIGALELNIGSAREIRKPIDSILNVVTPNDISLISNTVISILGKWKLDDIEPNGYFNINNASSWRSVYGDIDMDAYPTENYADFMDMFWGNDNLRKEMVNNLYEKFIKSYNNQPSSSNRTLAVNSACFAVGIPSVSEIWNYRSAYYNTLKSFIMETIQAFSINNSVQKSLSLKYILNHLYQITEFRKNINNLIDNFRISKKEGGSIMLIAEESDAFSKLYKEFSIDFLTPLFKELPEDSQIDRKIDNVVKKQTTIFGDLYEE